MGARGGDGTRRTGRVVPARVGRFRGSSRPAAPEIGLPAPVTLEGMEVVPHADVGEFAGLARPLLEPEPERHTSLLTVLDGVCRGAFAPAVMLTAQENGATVAAVLRTTGHPALVSAVPRSCAEAVAGVLARVDPDVPGAQGPVAQVEAFAAAWATRTGVRAEAALRMRLFALDALSAPVDVAGCARVVGPAEAAAVDLLVAWREAFGAELARGAEGPPRREVVLDAITSGGGELLWEVDGEPVAQASARAVTAGMSRIGPVYTPLAHRRHGYAAAVTAAAARWALDRGARYVLLYTDLANPTTNRLYPRLGFRPRYDALELRFVPPEPAG